MKNKNIYSTPNTSLKNIIGESLENISSSPIQSQDFKYVYDYTSKRLEEFLFKADLEEKLEKMGL